MKYSLLLVLIFATVTMAYVQRANLPSAALIAAKPKNNGNIIDDAIGFVKDLRRLNVALTRARHCPPCAHARACAAAAAVRRRRVRRRLPVYCRPRREVRQ